ncbi:MAG: hypothetical protein ACR2OZ_05190 [Verrucomicrobiales bacterium]
MIDWVPHTKIDSDGQRAWVVVEPDLYLTGSTQIALDGFGNVYVTGTVYHPATFNNVATAKYNRSGQGQWIVHSAAPGSFGWSGTGVGVDARGDVHVAGFGPALIGQGSDLLLLRYRQHVAEDFQLGFVREGNGLFRLTMPPGSDFTVEASSDLVNWTIVEEPELSELRNSAISARSGFRLQFYRLVREN